MGKSGDGWRGVNWKAAIGPINEGRGANQMDSEERTITGNQKPRLQKTNYENEEVSAPKKKGPVCPCCQNDKTVDMGMLSVSTPSGYASLHLGNSSPTVYVCSICGVVFVNIKECREDTRTRKYKM